MARPRKKPEDQRIRVLSVRLTAAEYAQVDEMAKKAGMLSGPYARETILNKRPRSRPAKIMLMQNFLNELTAIAGNFGQLAAATGDDLYLKWSKYVNGTIVEQTCGREDLLELIEEELPKINAVGHMVNDLAFKGNCGEDIERAERDEVLHAVKKTFETLFEASKNPPKRKKKQHSKFEEPPKA